MNLFKIIKLFFFPTEEWRQYRKALKAARKEYPKGTPMRMMHIHNYLHYSNMARREKEMFEMYASPEEKLREKARKRALVDMMRDDAKSHLYDILPERPLQEP